jgi:hypothetical protein
VGAGLQLAVTGSAEGEVPVSTRLLVAGGVAVYLVAVSATNTGMAGRARSGWWFPLAAAAVAALDVVLELPAAVVVGAVALLVVVVVLVGSAERATGRLAVDQV